LLLGAEYIHTREPCVPQVGSRRAHGVTRPRTHTGLGWVEYVAAH
jgi:hypothetical protein